MFDNYYLNVISFICGIIPLSPKPLSSKKLSTQDMTRTRTFFTSSCAISPHFSSLHLFIWPSYHDTILSPGALSCRPLADTLTLLCWHCTLLQLLDRLGILPIQPCYHNLFNFSHTSLFKLTSLFSQLRRKGFYLRLPAVDRGS